MMSDVSKDKINPGTRDALRINIDVINNNIDIINSQCMIKY